MIRSKFDKILNVDNGPFPVVFQDWQKSIFSKTLFFTHDSFVRNFKIFFFRIVFNETGS